MAIIQDFSIAQGDDLDVTFSLDPTDNISLDGARVTWAAFEQSFAVPESLESGGEVILKSSDNGGVTVIPSPLQFIVHLTHADTDALYCGNYYHEAEVVDVNDNHATVCRGMMTVALALLGD